MEEAAANNIDSMLPGIERKERLREEKQEFCDVGNSFIQCSGSGSGAGAVGSGCFWAAWIRICNLFVRIRIQAISKKVHIQIPRLRVQHVEKIV